MSSIKISPKHGLNPSMTVCFWCGEESGIALMGRVNRNDDEAPKRVFAGYTPCKKCEDIFSRGVHVIGVTTEKPDNELPPISVQDGVELYPTGVFAVVSHDSIIRVLNNEEKARQVLDAGKMLMDSDLLKGVLDSYNKNNKEEFTDEDCECGVPENSGTIPDEED